MLDTGTVTLAVFLNSLLREGGGLIHAVRQLSEAIANAGWDVRVFGPTSSRSDEDGALWGDIRPFGYPRHLLFNPPSTLHKLPPDVIHFNGIWLPYPRTAYSFARANGIPTVISPHGMLDAWALRHARIRKRLAGWLYEHRNLRNATCIHALCESEYRAIRAFGLQQQVAVIPNGVETPPPMHQRAMLPWPFPAAWRSHPVLLFLSRIHPKKGLIPLLKGWQQVATMGTPWRLAIVGPDENDHASDILALIENLALESSAAWLGPKYGQDRDACYHHATAFILPSYSEGFPMAALEALSFGLPAILTPACHLPEAREAGAALMAEPTAESLSEALRRLFSLEATELEAMGCNGEALVQASFDWRPIAERMIAVYRWLIAPDAHPMPADVRVD